MTGALSREYRRSIARCEARWLAAGVDSGLAGELAADLQIGRAVSGMLPTAAEPLRVIEAVVGAGKSLIGERAYQEAVRARESDGAAPLPCWLRARDMKENLESAILTATREIGEMEKSGAFVVVDGADEAGLGAAEELLEEARTLVRAYDGLRVLISTRPLTPFLGAEEVVRLDELSDEEALATVWRVARREVLQGEVLAWPHSLKEAIRRPLFAVLLGVFFRDGGQVPPPAARLLGRVIERAIGRWQGGDPELLRRVAARAIAEGGASVPRGALGDRASEDALAETRLVTVNEEELRFPLVIVAQWFAAESIAVGETPIGVLLDRPDQLELWRYPLAIAVGAFGSEDAERALAAMAEREPGFASQVVEEGLSRWAVEGRGVGEPEGAARRVRDAMQSWAVGLGPLGELCAPLDEEGRLAPIGYHADGDRFDTGWYRGTDREREIRRLPGDTWSFMLSEEISFEERQVWYRARGAAAGGEPSWEWRWAFEDLRDGLSAILRERKIDFLDGPLREHRLWVLARWILRENWWRRDPIAVQAVLDRIDARSAGVPEGFVPIADPRRDIFEAAKRDGITTLVSGLEPPREDFGGGKVWDAWDRDGHLRRTQQAYELALSGLLHLLTGRFRRLAPWMQTASTLPAVLHIEVDFSDHPYYLGAPTKTSWLEPLPDGSESRVEARFGKGERWDADRWHRQMTTLRRLRPRQSRWIGVVYDRGVLRLDEENCVEEIIYKWLWDDLTRNKWVTGLLGTRTPFAMLGP